MFTHARGLPNIINPLHTGKLVITTPVFPVLMINNTLDSNVFVKVTGWVQKYTPFHTLKYYILGS